MSFSRYRERRLAAFFRNAGEPEGTVLSRGSSGPAITNLGIALRHLGYKSSTSSRYDQEVESVVRQFQADWKHSNVDGLVGPGTRALLARALDAKAGDRFFSLMEYPHGEPFPRLFVSYAREDRRQVENIVSYLRDAGVRTWVDYMDLLPGAKWRNAISSAIADCRYFLALISAHTLSKKGFVQREVRTAWSVADEYPDTDIFIMPARLEPCHVRDPRFSELNWVDLFPEIEPGLERILAFLAGA